jgi:hypothetical protein
MHEYLLGRSAAGDAWKLSHWDDQRRHGRHQPPPARDRRAGIVPPTVPPATLMTAGPPGTKPISIFQQLHRTILQCASVPKRCRPDTVVDAILGRLSSVGSEDESDTDADTDLACSATGKG